MSHVDAFRDGLVAAKAGKRILARIQFEQAVEIEPQFVPAWLWLAWTADSPDQAVDFLQRARDMDPEDSLVNACLSVTSLMANYDLQEEVPTSPASASTVVDIEPEQSAAQVTDAVDDSEVRSETAPEESAVALGEGVEEQGSNDSPPTEESTPLEPLPAEDSVSTNDVEALPSADEAPKTDAPVDVEVSQVADLPTADLPSATDGLPPATESELIRDVGSLVEEVHGAVEPGFSASADEQNTSDAQPAAVEAEEDTHDFAVEDADAATEMEAPAQDEATLSTASETQPETPALPEESTAAVDDAPSHELASPDIEIEEEAPPAPTSASVSSSQVILAVDDSPTVRKLVSMTLEGGGYEVKTAENGIEAMKMLVNFTPGLILLDVNMPRMDGYKLCKLIKSHGKTKDIPVVMLSGKDGVFDKLRGKLVGCNDYISKPFESADLLRQVQSYVGPAPAHA